jgi:hypothetical protein
MAPAPYASARLQRIVPLEKASSPIAFAVQPRPVTVRDGSRQLELPAFTSAGCESRSASDVTVASAN